MRALRSLAPWGLLLALCGCDVAQECAPAVLARLDESPAYACVTSLFRESSAVALGRSDGALLTEAWIDSGSPLGAGAVSLGGDLALPTTETPGELVLLERLGVDLITRIGVPSGEVLGQHSVLAAPAGETAYRANPQDALRLSPTELLVSRHEPNLHADAPPLDRGDDLVIIDLEADEITARIGLEALVQDVAGSRVYARPSRMVRRGGVVVVGLTRLDARFRVAGRGGVALVDLTTRAVTEVPLAGLANCGEVRAVEGSDTDALVLCAGQTFADAEGRRPSAGLVLLRVAGGTAEVAYAMRASEHPELPPPQLGAVSLGGTRAVYLSLTLDEDRTDALIEVDLASGAGKVVHTATLTGDDAALGFNLGPGALLGSTLLVPSATEGALRYEVSPDDLRPLAPEAPSPCRRLPAREIARLRAP